MVDQKTDALNGNRKVLAYDTKLIWEQFLNEIVETRRELSERLDRIEAIVIETRATVRRVKDRLDKAKPKLAQ